jgi:hypothetical protein
VPPVINELLLGSKVMLLDGASICAAEPLNLAFSGSTKTVEGFLSLPQGHKPVEFKIQQPTAPCPKKPDKKEIWYDLQCNVTKRMCKIQKDLHTSFNLPCAPPPPKNTAQIVKLKWLPSKQSKRRAVDGIWHGLHAVNMGASTTLQECSLTEDWVESAFSVAFRKECKDIAAGDSVRNKNKYLCIPAGDDPPLSEELLSAVSVQCQQGVSDSCLRHSMAGAFHAMGFTRGATTLALEESTSGCTVALHYKMERHRSTPGLCLSGRRCVSLTQNACAVCVATRLCHEHSVCLHTVLFCVAVLIDFCE